MGFSRFTACLALLLTASATAATPPFAIDLKVVAAGRTSSNSAPTSRKDRPVLKAKAGQPLTIQWKIANADPRKTQPGVTIHFFCAPQAKLGQIEPPGLERDVCAESAVAVDMRPGESATGEMTFALDKPGIYQARLEAIETTPAAPPVIPEKALDNIAEIAKRKRAAAQAKPEKPKPAIAAVLDVLVE